MPVHDGVQLLPDVKMTFTWNKATDIPYAVLQLKNNAIFAVVANVKTTNPARYKVTPPNAIVRCGKSVKIKFQFTERDAVSCWNGRLGELKADRFMIQTAKVMAADAVSLPEVNNAEAASVLASWWNATADADKDKPKGKKCIHAQKLESVFVFPGEPGSATWGSANMELVRLQRRYEDLEQENSELKIQVLSAQGDRDMIKEELDSTKSELISALTMQTGLQMALTKAQKTIASLKDGGDGADDGERDQSSLLASFCACGLAGEGDAVAAGLADDDDVHNLPKPVEREYSFNQPDLGLDLKFDASLETIVVAAVHGQAKILGVRGGDLVVKLNGRDLVHPQHNSSVTDVELLKLLAALPRPVKLTFSRATRIAPPKPPAPRR